MELKEVLINGIEVANEKGKSVFIKREFTKYFKKYGPYITTPHILEIEPNSKFEDMLKKAKEQGWS